jgi:molecular chaperone DnaK
MGKIIGIDLGTTNSAAAYMDRRDPRIIINEEGGRITPSVVGFSKMGDRFVGDVAKRQMLINPHNTISSIKRFMGKRHREAKKEMEMVNYTLVEVPNGDIGVEVNGRVYSPQEISAMILQKIKKCSEDFLGETVTEAIITVPAYFTDRQRQATKEAGTLAGLNVLRIINEPTAAALAYVHDKRKSSVIAVYDFGGGTFDISVLQVDRDVAEVLATRGNNTLGGNDIDERIVGWLMNDFQKTHRIDVSEDKVVLQRLRDAAERAKIDLSSVVETEINLPFLVADSSGPRHLQATLTRDVFERLALPLFEETIKECRAVLEDARLSSDDIDEVVLVGGSSRIPRVQSMVRDLFQCPLNKSFNPDEVVAIGAAIQGAMLEGEVKAVTLLDVTNFSLGIEVEGQRFAKLIPKNTTIPTQRTQLVSTVVDNQQTVKIHVLQGENAMAYDNVSLGEFELQGVQPAPRGGPRIEVKFSIDVDGIVHVSAQDMRSGRTEKITIQAPGGVSALTKDKLQEEGTTFTSDASPELGELRQRIGQQLVSLEALLRDQRGFLHQKDIFELELALKRGRMALVKSGDRTNLEELLVYLSRFYAHIQDKLRGSDAPVH